MDGYARSRWSTADVEGADAFAYWSDIVCDTFVGVAMRPGSPEAFEGRIEHFALDGIDFALVSAGPQQVARTSRLIARDHGEFFLANIQIRGQARLEQNERVAVLSPGAMAFADSTRPYALSFAGDFSQLVVKVPRTRLPRRSLIGATAVETSASGPGRVVADFLVGVDRLQAHHPAAATALIPHAVELLYTALGWAVGGGPPESSALMRERIHRFVRRHAHDPSLDVGAVAAGCGLSRRTMFRVLAEDGESLTAMIRRLRVSHAQRLIRTDPVRPLAAVARDCGFGGEAQLYRAFRTVTGMTPGTYRSQEP